MGVVVDPVEHLADGLLGQRRRAAGACAASSRSARSWPSARSTVPGPQGAGDGVEHRGADHAEREHADQAAGRVLGEPAGDQRAERRADRGDRAARPAPHAAHRRAQPAPVDGARPASGGSTARDVTVRSGPRVVDIEVDATTRHRQSSPALRRRPDNLELGRRRHTSREVGAMRRVARRGGGCCCCRGAGASARRPQPASRRVVPCSRGLVALTFDDGPSATVTPRLVRLLQRIDVPATFFMIGSRVDAHPELVADGRASRVRDRQPHLGARPTSPPGPTPRSGTRSARPTGRWSRAGRARRPTWRGRRTAPSTTGSAGCWTGWATRRCCGRSTPRDWAGASTAQIAARVLAPYDRTAPTSCSSTTASPTPPPPCARSRPRSRRPAASRLLLRRPGRRRCADPAGAGRHRHRGRSAGSPRVAGSALTVQLDRPTSRPTSVRVQGRSAAVRRRRHARRG